MWNMINEINHAVDSLQLRSQSGIIEPLKWQRTKLACDEAQKLCFAINHRSGN